jgi:DNA-binding NarL/FixJ family response regulator
VAEGQAFHDEDFDRSRTFDRPLDSIVLATGFHSGCSVPLRDRGQVVGAISLSASTPREAMSGFVAELEPLGDVLAAEIAEPAGRALEVLVCHADPLASRGIAGLLEAHGGVRARVAATLAAARDAASVCVPDVLVCDDWLDGERIDAVARALQEAGVDAPLVVVSSRERADAVSVALRAGAVAHIAGRDAVRDLPAALDALRQGDTLSLPQPERAALLTAREQELLESLEEGLRFKQVARRLGISEATAKTHARNLFRKLDATSRAEAVHTARERGLLA